MKKFALALAVIILICYSYRSPIPTVKPRFLIQNNTTFTLYNVRSITVKNNGGLTAYMSNSLNETMTIAPAESIDIGNYGVNVSIDNLSFICTGTSLKIIYYQ